MSDFLTPSRLEDIYMSEKQQVSLSIWCDKHANDNHYVFETTKQNYMDLLQEYVDTGGDEAGEYIKAVPNLIGFIDQQYDFLKETHAKLKERGLYRMDLLEFCFTTYREFIFQTLS